MTVCLIGNSHSAMLIAANRDAARPAGLTVFAKPSLEADMYRLEGSLLRATDPALIDRLAGIGTPPEVDLARCDAVVIAGLSPSVFGAVRLCQDHRVADWPSGRLAMAQALLPSGEPPARSLISLPAYRAALCGMIEASPAMGLIRSLRLVSDVPVAVVPQPYPSEAVLDGKGRYPVFRRVVEGGDAMALAQALEAAQAEVFGALSNVALVAQPDATIAHGCLTQGAFMRGAVRLSLTLAQPKGDVMHGNAELGALYWNKLKGLPLFHRALPNSGESR